MKNAIKPALTPFTLCVIGASLHSQNNHNRSALIPSVGASPQPAPLAKHSGDQPFSLAHPTTEHSPALCLIEPSADSVHERRTAGLSANEKGLRMDALSENNAQENDVHENNIQENNAQCDIPKTLALTDTTLVSDIETDTSDIQHAGFGGAPNLQVPSLSLQDWERASSLESVSKQHQAKLDFVNQIDDALAKYGFLAIVDHGIPAETIDAAFNAAQAFFQLPDTEKMQLHLPGVAGHRGYTPDGETAKGAIAPDLKEFVQLGASNNPSPERVPEFIPALKQLMNEFARISHALLQAIALQQVGDEHFFDKIIDHEATILRALHYPPLADDVPAFSERATAHEDINLITLLLSGKATTQKEGASGQGLQLKVPKTGKRAQSANAEDFHWVNAIVPKGALIINIGEMLENWTNGAWRATTHRVINPPQGDPERQVGRLSMPYFVHPKGEFSLKPHPKSIANAGGIQHYPDTDARTALNKRLRELGLLKN